MRRHSVASSTPLNDLSDASRMNPLFMPQPQLFGGRNHGTDGAGPVEPETYNTRLTESAQNCTHWLKRFPLDDNKEANHELYSARRSRPGANNRRTRKR